MNAALHIAVLYGGQSVEHEVSVHSAQPVCEQLRANGHQVTCVFIDRRGHWWLQQGCGPATPQDIPITPVIDERGTLFIPSKNLFLRPDVFFPVLHGTYGEDGCVQGLLECLDVPYAGCGVAASAAGMDKAAAKLAAERAGVATLPYYAVSSWAQIDWAALEQWAAQTGYPIFVKPAHLGSSVGVSKVKTPQDLRGAVESAKRFDTEVLVEQGLENPREVFCAVLGEGAQARASLCGELKNAGAEFFDYQAKYVTAGGCEMYIPADLPPQTAEQIRQDTLAVYRALGCSGLSRADFLIDKQGKAWFGEINTLPGMSDTSLYPQLFAASGVDYATVLEEILQLALQVHARKHALRRERGTL